MDLIGSVVWSKDYSQTEADIRIEFSYLQSGFYFVELANGTFQTVKKLQVL